ncbi:ankyrin repeat-containing protein ITN1-like [Pistacia vera]|uniref:ankyrin repeat-containing protein ITN1-like n=1 Tax=Pistacia vera TaxID=55513 RepID=UPI001263BF18|nr:ankyrin repeat-containing protein ITN1-like [Pistacia vera]
MEDIDVHKELNDIDKATPTQVIRWPSLRLLSGKNKALYFDICVPLNNAAINGDIEEVKRFSMRTKHHHPSVLCTAITKGYETILHVAADAGQTRFVREIVKLMKPEELMLQDINGNTAFCFAVMIGSLQIVQIMLEMNQNLLTIRGGKNMLPLYLAALFGHEEMAKFLYRKAKQYLTKEDRKSTFIVSVLMGLYDFALTLLEDDKELAAARHVQFGTALHMLAQNPSAFVCRSTGPLKRLISSFSGMKFTQDTDDFTSTPALKLVQSLWRETIRRDDVDALEFIRNPSNLLFDAIKSGNFAFLAEIIRSYPDLVHELDENDQTIFHIAVLHGHTNILDLVHEIGFAKELLATYRDKDGNNILHLAAKYQHPSSASTVPDAALEMQRELLKLKEVEKIAKPSFKEMRNSEGKTPRELFTVEHSELLKGAKVSTKKAASSCMTIASLVTVVMFAAAFSTVGNNGEIGRSINRRKNLYHVFVIADAIALFCSSISMLNFLSILTLHCAEDDFLKSLPLKLMTGLSAFYVSIITMLIAFTSVFFLTNT